MPVVKSQRDAPAAVVGFRHVGIVVHDLDRALAFYRDLLGLQTVSEREEGGEFIDTVTGLRGVRLRWVKLEAPDGAVVELLRYDSHPRPPGGLQESCRPGCSHVAFRVADLEAVHRVLSAAGATFKGKPVVSPDGFARVAYCHDPEGNILELVELLQPQSSTPPRPR